MITATGLGSGLDINGLVSQLVAAERAGPDLQLDRQNAKLGAKFSALGSLKGALSSFRGLLSSANALSNFSKNTVSSSAYSELSASADSTAIANDYAIDVTQLASSHSLASAAFADSDTTALGTGTMTIRFGTTDYTPEVVPPDTPAPEVYTSFLLNPDSSTANITIDSSNNTLEGIMGAINDAGIGVSASIVNDGTGFRLLMTSDATGAENSLEISVDDDDLDDVDNATGISRLVFNSSATNLDQTAAAKDAKFTINGLAVTNDSNTVTSAIPGVTLSLSTITTSTVNLAVKADTATINSSVNSFVTGYNNYISTVNSLTAYDAENDIPSVLLGDIVLRSINGQVDDILRNAVSGITGAISTLAELGITTTSSGTLEVDSAKLSAALAANPLEAKQIFAAIGVPEDEDISFDTSSDLTVAGDYALNITTLATSGVHTGAAVLPDFPGVGTLDIDVDNDEITFEIDGIDIGSITLTAGTYTTGTDLAAEIQTQINGTTAMRDAERTVVVAYDSGTDTFSITSGEIGSLSTVNVLAVDTNTAAELGFSVSSGVDGVDVAGTINGNAATGAGNLLVADAGSDAEGLSLLIGGTTTGARGNVNFTRGIANQLDILLGQFLDTEGALEDRIDTYQDRIDEVAERRSANELRWEALEARYSRQFNALDSLLAGLQSTSAYMENQFKNLVKPNAINS